MILLISPAKRLNEKSNAETHPGTNPIFTEEAYKIIKKLRTLSKKKIKNLMGINDDLVTLNHQRYQDWTPEFVKNTSKQAVFLFNGEVYLELQAGDFTNKEMQWAQEHLRILSGLYGILRPLDWIQPYRLEMGTKLPIQRKPDLHKFWKDDISALIDQSLKEQNLKTPMLINLASKEYFKSVDTSLVSAKIIHPDFLEKRDGNYKMIGFLAKKARGKMSRYLIKKQASTLDDILSFNADGYQFNSMLSKENHPIFTREN